MRMRLAYGPDVPQALIDQVEFHARSLGLPLHLLEMMGQSTERAEQFIVAAERGLGMAFAMNVCYGEPFDAFLKPPVALAAIKAEAALGVDR